MACNTCSINGITFPDFVSNGCCNPVCEDIAVAGASSGCGCCKPCGEDIVVAGASSSNPCGCNTCCNPCGCACGCNCGCHNPGICPR